MIVCSCNIISSAEIEQVISDLLSRDAWQVIVPLQVYHELGKRGKCCGCFPHLTQIIVNQTKRFHAEMNSPQADVIALIDRLQRKHETAELARTLAKAVTFKTRAA